MKFEKTKEKSMETKDAESYRKFLAGNKTLYTQAFWENGPRRTTQKKAKLSGEALLPSVQGARG